MSKRVIVIVLDSVGIGELPDAHAYGDQGSNTLGNIARSRGGLCLPHLASLGLGKVVPVVGVPPVDRAAGAFGRMAAKAAGKDTTSGHWELAGLILDRPFPVYPNGFPPEIIREFEARSGLFTLGNKPASGTEIIAELGEEHLRTGFPIVYTSADSVFQIAAHEEVIPPPELYRLCRIARDILTGEHAVGRVIARPFVGRPGNFTRTANRHDFSLAPPGLTVLDLVSQAGLPVIGIGKINDIFAGQGVTESIPTKNNRDGIAKTIAVLEKGGSGFVFVNLVDFDSQYGHRNDVAGYAAALEEFDRSLPALLAALTPDDVLMITADHGCDPTTPSTDHSREYVPLLVYGQTVKENIDLGTRASFADVGATVADLLGVRPPSGGESFAALIQKGERPE